MCSITIRGRKEHGTERSGYAQADAANAHYSLLAVQQSNGQQILYDLSRLRIIGAYCEIEREFAVWTWCNS